MTTEYTLEHAMSDLVDANQILVSRGVLDAYGHVSARHPDDPQSFLISRNLAPARVRLADVQVYDLDGASSDDRPGYLERYIHGEIYRSRPDVQAVVHSHSATMVPFSIAERKLTAVWHMAGFLGAEVPVFEIRQVAGDVSDLLIRDRALGAALATALGDSAVVLMRGHGSVAVGDSLPQAVHRAVFAELNARVQATALQLGEIIPLSGGEAVESANTNDGQIRRAWELWQSEAREASR